MIDHPKLEIVEGDFRHVECVVEAMQDVDHEIQGSGDRFAIRLQLENGRGQTVNVEVTDDAETHEQIVRIFSDFRHSLIER